MLAGELRKQKGLFAAVDSLALLVAFAAALLVHDPSDAMLHKMLAADWTLVLDGAAGLVVLWVLVFRACDLYRMRAGGAKESIATVKACSVASLLTLGFLCVVHEQGDVSRLTVGIAFLISMPSVFAARHLL